MGFALWTEGIDSQGKIEGYADRGGSEANMKAPLKHFSHRGIGFSKTPKGHWFFDTILNNGGHWSRYAKDDELPYLDGTCEDDERVHAIMCRMIDRQSCGNVMYNGDIREKRTSRH